MNHEASARLIINMPREQVWERLRDLSLAHQYVPGIVGCELTTEKVEGHGASRRVHQKSGKFLDETVIDWHEGQGFCLRLHRAEGGAPPPFSRASFRYHIDDASQQRTALLVSLSFDMRWGWLGRMLYNRLLRRPVRSTVRDVALSMKHFYETGQPLASEDLPALRAARLED